MDQSVDKAVQQVIEVVSTYGLSIVGAVLILIGGFWIAGWAARATRNSLIKAPRIDDTLAHFFSSLVRYTIIAFTVIAVLNQFGVQTTSIIALLGAGALAVGLALQGTLSNIAAGVMLLIFRPFRVGQYIEVGAIAGTVESISLFVTELNTPDNVHIVMPNGQLWGTAIKNYSHNERRRADITVGIDYGDDIGKATDIIRRIVTADSRAGTDPEPQIVVVNLGDSSVDIQARIWCAASDFWPMKFDLTRAIKEALDAEGITIPFPQRVVHMQGAS